MVPTPRPVNLQKETAAGITLVPYFQVPEEPSFTEAGPFAALLHQQLQQISLKEGSMGLFKTMSLPNRKRMICNCLRVKKVRVTWGEAGLSVRAQSQLVAQVDLLVKIPESTGRMKL